ncbi:MAG: hypothetical protein ABWX92_16290 [Mycetocola sp.]
MSSVPNASVLDRATEQFEWVEIKAPKNAVMRSGNARIVGAIARLRGDNASSVSVDPSLTRVDDESDEAFARYAAERWDD